MAQDTHHKRRQLFVDADVQGAVLRRVVVYWFTCLVTVFVGLLCYRIAVGPARPFYTHLDDMWFHYGPVFIASTLILPIIMFDCLKLTNRFAGPIFRLRRDLNNLAQGRTTYQANFRDSDYWHEIADSFQHATRSNRTT